jgi:hypothetical protein
VIAITSEIGSSAFSPHEQVEDAMETVRGVEKADHYREEAKSCLEIAERMPAVADRALLLDMAQHWLDMAVKTEAAEQTAFGSRG